MKYSRLSKRLPEKRAFVTGAAGGLGFAFSKALAEDGWMLGISDIDPVALAEAAGSLRALGASVQTFVFDVSDFAAYAEAARAFLEKLGGLDLLINNAGIGCGGFLEELSIEDWRRAVNINLMGAVHGLKLFLPAMKKQNRGHILNLASAAAIVEGPQCSPYNITKAGLVALSESLSSELVDFDIRISVFMPSFIRTNIGNATIGDPSVRARAKALVSASRFTADWAAEQALRGMDRGKFYIVLPSKIRVLWLFKRLCPELFLRFIATYAKKRAAEADIAGSLPV